MKVALVDLAQVEEAAKELYIRALKALPPDIKRGFEALASAETDAGAKRMLGTMMRNIAVAEQTEQPPVPGHRHPGVQRVDRARRGSGRRGLEGSDPPRLRALDARVLVPLSIVHPTTRERQTSTGRSVPVINIDFAG